MRVSCCGFRPLKVLGVILGCLVLAVACIDEPFVETPADVPAVPPEAPIEPALSKVPDVGFASPIRIAFATGNWLLVSDSRRNRVYQVHAETLQASRALNVAGKPLAVGHWGRRLFVGNATRRTIEVFDRGGSLLYSFGAGAVAQPLDMAIDADLGRVFVTDGGRGEVKVFDVNGHFIRTITAVEAPTGIAVDPMRREVLVSDYGHARALSSAAYLKIFDYDGALLTQISGSNAGFSRPQGIAVDGAGRIFLADAVRAQVLVFDRNTLQQVAIIGSGDPAVSDLRLPADVVVDPKKGDVFVTSSLTHEVVAFRDGPVP